MNKNVSTIYAKRTGENTRRESEEGRIPEVKKKKIKDSCPVVVSESRKFHDSLQNSSGLNA